MNQRSKINKHQYLSSSPQKTKNFGWLLAKEILKNNPQKRAIIIGLSGELGGGKTTFSQGLAKGLGIKERILSPTFVLIKKYKLTHKFKNFYHIDCYRVEKPKELLSLGFKEIISEPKNIIIIEWVEKIRKILPRKITLIQFNFIDKNKRKITVTF